MERLTKILAQLPPVLYERFLAYGRGMIAALEEVALEEKECENAGREREQARRIDKILNSMRSRILDRP